NGSTCIARLFRWRRPTTILSVVIAIIIDAVERFRRRLFAHICYEVFKYHPGFVEAYSTASPSWVCLACRVSASFFHMRPDFICPGGRHSMPQHAGNFGAAT